MPLERSSDNGSIEGAEKVSYVDADSGKRQRPEKLAASLARKIEDRIILAGWPVDQVLGSEQDLIAEYGVSRGVFREAVRLLEHHSIARMRQGPHGGLVVTAPDNSGVTQAIALSLRYQRVTSADLVEARVVIESQCVRLAIERLDEDGIMRIRRTLANEFEKTGDPPNLRPSRFHLVIAELTGNPALHSFVEILMKLTTTTMSPEAREWSRGAAFYEDAYAIHKKIGDAIIVGDVGLALHRMTRHLSVLPRFTTA